MTYKPLDTIVLNVDLPEHGLRRGDLGAVAHVHDDGWLELEFVIADGSTAALVVVPPDAARPVAPTDLVTVRPITE